MKNSFYALCLVIVMLGLADFAKAQFSVRFEDGSGIVFSTKSDPPDLNQKIIGNLRTSSDKRLLSRIFVDVNRNVYFGYDLLVEPTAEAKKIKITVKPLSVPPSQFTLNSEYIVQITRAPKSIYSPQDKLQTADMKALPSPKFPEPQILQEGDTLALDVLINAQTGVKVVDLIKIASAVQMSGMSPVRMSPSAIADYSIVKDFTADAAEFRITSSSLMVNGQLIAGGPGKTRLDVSGALVWFYLPGSGRFILSLTPREGYGFQKLGTVQGNKITFSIGENRYEWNSNSPIVTGNDEQWNLWVLNEKNYVPEMASNSAKHFVFGSIGRSNYPAKKN